MKRFEPNLNILPAAQRRLWPELRQVPPAFVLYGGTAAGLRLGHRNSEDFDFFSSDSFQPEKLLSQISFLTGSSLLQSERNTLTVAVERNGPVKLSFFGGLNMGRVSEPESAGEIGLAVASLRDLAATKVKVVQERAERKDYLDVAALLRAGLLLPEMLGAARALYGDMFNPMITLRALSYFGDGDLPKLPEDVKQFLAQQASRVNVIPVITRLSDRIAP